MTRLPFILLAVLVVLTGMSVGCTSGTPSEEDAEKVILSYLRNSAVTISDNPDRNVQAVHVIEIGESYQQGRQTMWSVKISIVRPNKDDEQAEYVLFRDAFGNLKVLRRIATLPSALGTTNQDILARGP